VPGSGVAERHPRVAVDFSPRGNRPQFPPRRVAAPEGQPSLRDARGFAAAKRACLSVLARVWRRGIARAFERQGARGLAQSITLTRHSIR